MKRVKNFNRLAELQTMSVTYRVHRHLLTEYGITPAAASILCLAAAFEQNELDKVMWLHSNEFCELLGVSVSNSVWISAELLKLCEGDDPLMQREKIAREGKRKTYQYRLTMKGRKAVHVALAKLAESRFYLSEVQGAAA